MTYSTRSRYLACHGEDHVAMATCIRALSVDAAKAENRVIRALGQSSRKAWEGRPASKPAQTRSALQLRSARSLPLNTDVPLSKARADFFWEAKKVATRKDSQMALETLAPALLKFIGEFGAPGPEELLYEPFGIPKEAVLKRGLELIHG